MPATATFSHGLRSECADLPELLLLIYFVTVLPSAELLLHPPMKNAFGEGRMPAATAFSHGLRSECANLPELPLYFSVNVFVHT